MREELRGTNKLRGITSGLKTEGRRWIKLTPDRVGWHKQRADYAQQWAK